ncbi:serine/threonine-protein kinase pim-2-like [Myripristis murdjan]|uniref:serine/threonine-protein kinase pim-2-like n=1 Tax=Myripristis murdjan TaxID=586833 RepID=UPI0011762B47|nr:serine/threonine-protein kinase pim-2-like [Myripristis murdjan]
MERATAIPGAPVHRLMIWARSSPVKAKQNLCQEAPLPESQQLDREDDWRNVAAAHQLVLPQPVFIPPHQSIHKIHLEEGRQARPARAKRCRELSGLQVDSARADRRSKRKRRKASSERSQRRPQKTRGKARSSRGRPASNNSATGRTVSRAEFEAIYKELEALGSGGFGLVYSGYRKEDHLPMLDGKQVRFPLEVMLMMKAGADPGPAGSSAAVALLDWFYLEEQLILLMERPVPSMNFSQYLQTKGGHLQEPEAKVIMKQLVDAAIELQSKGVFHRDIKPANILVETASDVPHVRIIDFGCGCVLKEGSYTSGYGTFSYIPPEWHQLNRYSAETTTIWQLGVVMYRMLVGHLPFGSKRQILYSNVILNHVSPYCKVFLNKCLAKFPGARGTLEQLRLQCWLQCS